MTVSAPNTPIYPEADHTSTPTGLLLEGCTVNYDEYCIGGVLTDYLYEEVRDSRWLMLAEDELISAAHTVGVVPPQLEPSQCPGGKPPPTKVTFRAATISPGGLIEVDATARRAAELGFALKLGDGRWLRLGWDHSPSNREAEVFVAPPVARAGAVVYAIPCMAFERPIGKPALMPLRRGSVSGKPPHLIQPEHHRPEAAACDAGQTES